MKIVLITVVAFSLCLFNTANAQSISLPPSGDNQRSLVTQWIGLVSVTILYSSPDVAGPNGENRKGKIWGGVVPYGLADNNFGTAGKIPWRAGANENTIITFSHDVKIEGKEIVAGTYGLHMIPGKEKWIIIFSNSSDAWGSYFYNENKDALRIEVQSHHNSYTEWLNYSFIEKKPTYTIAALQWEELMVTFKIEADVVDLYVKQIRKELKGAAGFSWRNWVKAVDFCIENRENLDEALLWSEYAISAPFVGEKNFTTLKTKVNVLYSLGHDNTADDLLEEAILVTTATMENIDAFGQSLIKQGYPKKAMDVFELNRKKYPNDECATFIGLATGYQALGKTKQAAKYLRKAAENASEAQRDYYLALASNLEK